MLARSLFVALMLASSGYVEAAANEALSAQVSIRRDDFGVPHIAAETLESLAYGYGYTLAEDRLLQTARLFIKARGEEAAYFGEEFVESDFAIKQLRMFAGAEEGYAKLAPWVRAYIDAFAAGYNRFLEKHDGEFPDWVKPVNGVTVLAHTRRIVIMEFCMDLEQVAALMQGQQAALDTADSFEPGSNMWAINRARSASGNALLLGNPHLAWSGSHTWHECHWIVPGKINYHGATLIGFPMPALGFNEHLGWSHTVNPHDCDDIYELALDPDRPGDYFYEGRSIPMSKETLTVDVKTATGVERKTREAWWSHYGPIVKQSGTKAYAYKSPHFGEYRMAEQWLRMSMANNLDEFRRAVDMQALPMFNIGYADDANNCFYLCNGRFPDRPQGHAWEGIVPGGIMETEWTGILPQSRLPQLLNPAGGYVQNCNSAPWYTNAQALIDRRNYPAEVFPNENDLRTQISLQMLEGDTSITFEELLAYKFNTRLLLADRIKDDLVRIARGQTVDGVNLDDAARVLAAWDNTTDVNSVGSVLFMEFCDRYLKAAKPVFAEKWDESKFMTTPRGIGDEAAAKTHLTTAVRAIMSQYGAIEVPWGDVYRMRRGKVDVPQNGQDGDLGSFRVIWFAPSEDGKKVAVGGDSYVFAVEFSSPPRAKSILATSQNDNPKSRHYTDQTKMFARGEWKPVWFTEAEIEKHSGKPYRP